MMLKLFASCLYTRFTAILTAVFPCLKTVQIYAFFLYKTNLFSTSCCLKSYLTKVFCSISSHYIVRIVLNNKKIATKTN